MGENALSASLAKVTASLTGDFDVTTTVHAAMDSCTSLGAASTGVLVRSPSGRLEVLASSSHAAYLLELYQAMTDEGPCVEVINSGLVVTESGQANLRVRWPVAGRAIADAGYGFVLGLPLTWRGEVLGGLNMFFAPTEVAMEDVADAAQAIADLVMLAVLYSDDRPASNTVYSALQSALNARNVVEQAKGVIAHQDRVEMDVAFGRLIEHARTRNESISHVATSAVERAESGARWNGEPRLGT
jgi:GAF domain-containing protein